MAMPGTLDSWRNYFRISRFDIFAIMEHAILVAASDCPEEFRLRRELIAESLFSCKLTLDGDEGCKNGLDRDGYELEGGGSKGNKLKRSGDDQAVMNLNQVSNHSYGEAKALTHEIEEESQIVGNILRIKEVLDHCQHKSDSIVFDSLKRLHLMAFSVDVLKATGIGKSVNSLRKHGSKQICQLARTLIKVWKDTVDEWMKSTKAIASAEDTTEYVKPSVVDKEEGLPCPPLNEGAAFFVTQTTSIELSQFFDGMDDDRNLQKSGDFKNNENGRKPSTRSENVPKRKQPVLSECRVLGKVKKVEEMKKNQPAIKKQTAVVKANHHSNTESGPARLTKVIAEQKVSIETEFQQKSDKATFQKKPPVAKQDKLKCLKSLEDDARLEAAKRKLHERYQEIENAKKRRTIKVMELHDIPMQGLDYRDTPANHNRHWANGGRLFS